MPRPTAHAVAHHADNLCAVGDRRSTSSSRMVAATVTPASRSADAAETIGMTSSAAGTDQSHRSATDLGSANIRLRRLANRGCCVRPEDEAELLILVRGIDHHVQVRMAVGVESMKSGFIEWHV